VQGHAREADGFYHVKAEATLEDLKAWVQTRVARSLDLEGLTFTGQAEAPDLRTVSKLAGRALPEKGPLLVKATLTDRGAVYRIDLEARVEEILLKTTGTAGASLDGRDLDLTVDLEAPDVRQLAAFADMEADPVGPVAVKARIRDAEKGIRISDLQATLAQSDVAGQATILYAAQPPEIRAELVSKRLDLRPFEPEEAQKRETPQADTDAVEPAKPGVAKGGERIFPDDPLPYDELRKVNAEVEVRVGRFIMRNRDWSDVYAKLRLRDGRLKIDPFRADTGNGRLRGTLRVDAARRPPAVEVRFSANQVVLGELEATKDLFDGGETELHLEAKSIGRSVREIMASLDGELKIVVGEAELNSRAVDLMGIDLFAQLASVLDPKKQSDKTPVECATVVFFIRDGIARTDHGIVLATDQTFIIGSGTIDLRTEKLDIEIRSHARKGLNINLSEIAQMVKVGGTLAHPSPTVDVKGVVQTGATVGAAVATLGISYGAQKILETVTEDRSPCATALAASPPQETPAGSAEKGTSGLLK
jgi:uncharacterized protein involved in outer membrane biogenesis